MIRSGPDVYSSDSSTVSSPFPEKFLRRFTSLFTAAGFSLTSLQLTENSLKCIQQMNVLKEMKRHYHIIFFFTLKCKVLIVAVKIWKWVIFHCFSSFYLSV